jgi:hypothetical protein
MQAILTARAEEGAAEPVMPHNQSAASWGAILAGAFVAMAVSLVLLTLGAGFEFASVSPWTDHGISETTFNVTTAIWLIVTQWISACLGGYITGRLRTRWTGTHVHASTASCWSFAKMLKRKETLMTELGMSADDSAEVDAGGPPKRKSA